MLVFDSLFLVNLISSIAIVAICAWGYYRIKRPAPLFIAAAYALFAASHFFLLTQTIDPDDLVILFMRTLGYVFIIIGVFAILSEIIERKKTAVALGLSEGRLQAVFDQAAVGIAEFLPDGIITRTNPRFSMITGYSGQGRELLNVFRLLPMDASGGHYREFTRVMRGERLEYVSDIGIRTAAGGSVWCQVFLAPVYDHPGQVSGNPSFFTLIIEDISARKVAEGNLADLNRELEQRVVDRTADLVRANEALKSEVAERERAEAGLVSALHEKEVLMREIHHRVKNNLQIIVSLLYLQAKKSNDPVQEAGLADSQARVKSMALIHEKLYRSGDLVTIDFNGYLQNLTNELMAAYGVDRDQISVVIDAKNLPVTIQTAIPLGLIMNELISNSLKYAFPDSQKGEIRITGILQNGDGIEFRVQDSGVGLPANIDWQKTDSLGLYLVRLLTRQLKGTVDLVPGDGVGFVIRIPKPEKKISEDGG